MRHLKNLFETTARGSRAGGWTLLLLAGLAALMTPGLALAECPPEPPRLGSPGFWSAGNFGQAAGWLCPSRDPETGEPVAPCPCLAPFCDIPAPYCEQFWLEVDDPATPQTPDYFQNGCDFVNAMEQDAINLNVLGFSVRRGFEMTFGGPALDSAGNVVEVSKSLVLHELLADVDFDQKLLYGFAGSGDCVWLELGECEAPWQSAPVDPEGNWVADYSQIPDCDGFFASPGHLVTVHQWDEDGEETDLHWFSTSVPSVRCDGFDPPLARYPLKVRGNRALPLKARLFNAAGAEITAADVVAPPVVQVWFQADTATAQDVTADVLPPGQADTGNQFVYVDEGLWRFNLSTRGFSSPGVYEVTVSTGDDGEYRLYTYSNCVTRFVVE